MAWPKGVPRGPMPQETRDKISKTKEGNCVFSLETRERMRQAKLGTKLPPAVKEKIRRAAMGHEVSEQARLNHSRGAKRAFARKRINERLFPVADRIYSTK